MSLQLVMPLLPLRLFYIVALANRPAGAMQGVHGGPYYSMELFRQLKSTGYIPDSPTIRQGQPLIQLKNIQSRQCRSNLLHLYLPFRYLSLPPTRKQQFQSQMQMWISPRLKRFPRQDLSDSSAIDIWLYIFGMGSLLKSLHA